VERLEGGEHVQSKKKHFADNVMKKKMNEKVKKKKKIKKIGWHSKKWHGQRTLKEREEVAQKATTVITGLVLASLFLSPCIDLQNQR